MFLKPKKVIKKAVKKGAYAAKVGIAGARFVERMTNPIHITKMLTGAARGKGLVFPGSKYIGPGNPMNLGKPVNQADANAYQHDIDYDNYLKKGVKPKDLYAGYSDADQRLLRKTKLDTPEGIAVNLGMGAKKVLNKIGLTKRIRDKDVYRS